MVLKFSWWIFHPRDSQSWKFESYPKTFFGRYHHHIRPPPLPDATLIVPGGPQQHRKWKILKYAFDTSGWLNRLNRETRNSLFSQSVEEPCTACSPVKIKFSALFFPAVVERRTCQDWVAAFRAFRESNHSSIGSEGGLYKFPRRTRQKLEIWLFRGQSPPLFSSCSSSPYLPPSPPLYLLPYSTALLPTISPHHLPLSYSPSFVNFPPPP